MPPNENDAVPHSVTVNDESPNELIKLVEEKPAGSQAAYVKIQIEICLVAANPRRNANAVFAQLTSRETTSKTDTSKLRVRLCGFIEQCSKSSSQEMKGWAFSSEIYLQLLDLYLEWNEADAERSLRLVLDLLVDLMTRREEGQGRDSLKLTVLDSLTSIVARQSTKPLEKSAIMVLDRFLTKSVVSLGEIGTSYGEARGLELEPDVPDIQLWKSYVSELFNWMEIQFVCPVAGKFITTIYRHLRAESDKEVWGDSGNEFEVKLWHEWLLEFLMSKPHLLDGVKNYIFVPLFKSEKAESLALLGMMNRLDKDVVSPQTDMDILSTLSLASLEVGKRIGLVEEPGTYPPYFPHL
ncbi:hypothetical protein IMZ48_29185 [Candidatus Bathyarchaeota archaeon]|nr:hypothetical protein [Candidatus Bathyarchaeota archaeon]